MVLAGAIITWEDQVNSGDVYAQGIEGTANTFVGSSPSLVLADDSAPRARILPTSVLSNGTTALDPTVAGPALPAGAILNGSRYDIETTALLDGDISFSFYYGDLGVTGDESALQLLRYSAPDSMWTDITAGIDTAADSIFGLASSLSQFVIMSPAPVGVIDGVVDEALIGIQSAPNPFSLETRIVWSSPASASFESVEIVDVQGRLVRKLAGEPVGARNRVAVWDGRDRAGSAVAPGTYFARIEGLGVTRKIVRIR